MHPYYLNRPEPLDSCSRYLSPMFISWLQTAALFALALCTLRCASPDARADDGDPVAEFKARAGNITAQAISADGKFVLTGEDDGLVTLWSVTTGTTAHKYSAHERSVLGAALLPDGKRGVTTGDDNHLIVWDLATGKRLHEFGTGISIPLVLATHADLAATGCDDGQIILWDLDAGRRLTLLPHHATVCGLTFSRDGRLLAAGYSDGKVILWQSSDWTPARTLDSGDGASTGALAFSPDGKLLATGNQNGAGFIWNVATGAQLTLFAASVHPESTPTPPVAPVFPGSTITSENRGAILYLCFSPDASMLLASSQDNVPYYWDAKTGNLLGTAESLSDTRFYVARYGFPYATAAITPHRDFIVTHHETDTSSLAQVWRLDFKPKPLPQ
jgi:WD40 repeat protein